MDTTFNEIMKEIPKESNILTEHCMDMSWVIGKYMRENKINEKQLAKKLNTTESQISEWLSGVHDFTLSTISKIEAGLGIEMVPFLKIGFRKKKVA